MAINLEGNIIGLDLGSKRIGVARVNTFVKLPEPLELIDLTNQEALQAIQNIINNNDAVAVVIGLPRGLDGQETAQTAYCREFASKLVDSIEIPVYLIDEAGTSKEADIRIKAVKNVKVSRDSVAATIILEDFIMSGSVEDLKV